MATEPSERVTIVLDESCCAASAMCWQIAPQLFALSEHDEVATVLQATLDDPELIALAREAEGSCPTGAITVR